jgi:hypothetical protein
MENATDILKQLDADGLRKRLDALEAEEKAVKVLLRAATRMKKRPVAVSATAEVAR